MEFIYKPTGEMKQAYLIKETKNKYKINFVEGGKDYWYDKENIEILKSNSDELIIYSLDRECYKCKKNTKIYTYMIYNGTEESLRYPWDTKRLLNNQDFELVMLHMEDPEIEYYPIVILGQNSKLDKILMRLYSDDIRLLYSRTQKRKYAMNVCKHCGAKQGEFFIYRELNKIIKDMKEINIEKSVNIFDYL